MWLVTSMLAVVLALLVWSAVVVCGRFLVLRLTLPNDLPDTCRFEPPPPPPAPAVGAAQRAERWRERAAICQRAQTIQLLAWRGAQRLPADDDPRRQRLSAAAERAVTGMHEVDPAAAARITEEAAAEAEAAWNEIVQAVPAPDESGGNRRLLVLLVVLVLMVVWLAIGLPLLREHLAPVP